MPRVFGLIGHKLSHSFSGVYFAEKFEKESIADADYNLFEIPSISMLPQLISEKSILGLNVTIPYKKEVIPYLDEIDPKAERIGAINVIKVVDQRLLGFNSDYFGFKNSLTGWLGDIAHKPKALVLGTGGSSRAVAVALEDLSIPYQFVSRKPGNSNLGYDDLGDCIKDSNIIINTTPLGMYPETDRKPPIPYELLTADHFLYDLVYNPEETLFMKMGLANGCRVKNGLEMLHLQAEKSWEIWNS